MFVAAVAAMTLASCSIPYQQTGAITIRFPVGSDELAADDNRQIADTLAPLAGNPLAEVELTAYFPYGATSNSPAFTLAQRRLDRLRSQAAEVGLSLDLVGGSVSAVGWTYEAGEYRTVPYAADRLEQVDGRFRVKAACHPLVGLARQSDPYRTQ